MCLYAARERGAGRSKARRANWVESGRKRRLAIGRAQRAIREKEGASEGRGEEGARVARAPKQKNRRARGASAEERPGPRQAAKGRRRKDPESRAGAPGPYAKTHPSTRPRRGRGAEPEYRAAPIHSRGGGARVAGRRRHQAPRHEGPGREKTLARAALPPSDPLPPEPNPWAVWGLCVNNP